MRQVSRTKTMWQLRMCIIWLSHNLVEASFDLFGYLSLGGQLEPWELHPLVSYTSSIDVPSRVQMGHRRELGYRV